MEEFNGLNISDEDLFQLYEMLSNLVETARVGVMDTKLIKSVFNALSKYEKGITENDIISAWNLCKTKLQGIIIEEENSNKNAKELSDLMILIDFFRNLFYGVTI